MNSGEIVDSVDVSDVCADIDRVTLRRDRTGYSATPFVEQGHGFEEVAVDLTDYPAVVAIAKRAFDTDRAVTFRPPATLGPPAEGGDNVN